MLRPADLADGKLKCSYFGHGWGCILSLRCTSPSVVDQGIVFKDEELHASLRHIVVASGEGMWFSSK